MKPRLESNPISAEMLRGLKKKPCVHQDPETPKRLSQTCLSVFECLLQRHRSAVACMGTEALGAADLKHAVCGISPIEGGHH